MLDGQGATNASGVIELHKNLSSSTQLIDQSVSTVSYILRQVYLILLVLLGLPGNFLVIFVAMSKECRKIPSSYYLLLMAMSDSVYLIVLFLLVLTRAGYPVLNVPIICPLVYITYVSDFVTTYVFVAFTVHRYFAVRFPLYTYRYSPIIVKCAIVIILMVGFVLYSVFIPALHTQSIDDKYGFKSKTICTLRNGYRRVLEYATMMDAVFVFVIPYMLLYIFNMLILKCLRKKRLPLCANEVSVNVANKNIGLATCKITTLILITTILYPLINAPYHLVKAVRLLFGSVLLPNVPEKLKYIEDQYLLFLYYCSHAMHIYVYIIFVGGFRKDVIKFARRYFHRERTSFKLR